MTKEKHQQRLQQAGTIEWFRREIPLSELVPVYFSDIADDHNYGVYCALIPEDSLEPALSKPTWDLSHGRGKPGATCYYENGNERVEYHRFGNDDGIEPLVIDRHFHGIRPDYKEISEEFRLFHKLFHDRKTDQYLKIDDAGNEELIAVVSATTVKIRLKEIRQFLAIKEMYLSLQFDYREHAPFKLEELGLKVEGSDVSENLMCWALNFGDLGYGKQRAFSRLLGKRLIKPLPKEKSGFWGYASEEPKKCVDFLIGFDEHGKELFNTSDEDELANYFGANPGAPPYLTPVHFRKQVLDKYYQQPGKYKVEDAYLRCGSLWGLQMDNHHTDRVCAWLGDLGRDLPYEEQLHWKSHNIPPLGEVSETFFRRQILAQFTDSNRPEHNFQTKYAHLSSTCALKLGWQLLKPLKTEDLHHLECVRIPASDEQREFDDLVLSLTKILIDSLNEKELARFIPVNERTELKGSISLLQAAFSKLAIQGSENHISFLRDLQELRSSSAAHRKGSKYKKIAAKFAVDDQPLRAVFTGILEQSLQVLDLFLSVVESGKLASVSAGNAGTT